MERTSWRDTRPLSGFSIGDDVVVRYCMSHESYDFVWPWIQVFCLYFERCMRVGRCWSASVVSMSHSCTLASNSNQQSRMHLFEPLLSPSLPSKHYQQNSTDRATYANTAIRVMLHTTLLMIHTEHFGAL
jgi:hypothetical protein